MCGIAGIVAWDDRYRVNRATLERMSARIAHRGPDDQGLHLNHEEQINPAHPQVGLVHRRLAIIDLDPRANQPFTDHQGRWIVFNGEIYNYRELRHDLARLKPDYTWRTTSDTEVLLLAYAIYGEKCVDHLNGMFAFAIWDEANQSLFLARDRMGQKPLYVACLPANHQTANTPLQGDAPLAVAFASELSAMRALPWFDATLNPRALGLYLSLGYIPDTTIYNGARKMQAATGTLITARSMTSRYYFQPFQSSHQAGLPDDEACATTRRLFVQAVRRQLVADVPVGCFLSGGIDSSVTAAAMKAAVPADQPIFTFCIGFDDPRYNETAYACAIARHLGTHHYQFTVKPDAAADLPRLAEVYGEPFADSSALPTHYLSRETRQHVKVALSGDGGDELFGGYDRYRALALTQWLSCVPGMFIRAVTSPLQKLLPGVHAKNRIARLKRLLASAHLSPARRYAAYMHLFSPEQLDELLHPDLFETAAGCEYLVPFFETGLRARPLVPNALAIDRLTYLPEDLHTKVDRAAMLHALEVRSPFMDPELVQFAAGLSTDQLLRGGPKRMLREAFAADLPEFVFNRRKMGFAVPIGEWFRNSLRPMLHDLLFAADSFASQHFRRPVLQRLIDEHEQSRADHAQRLYALLMLELWHHTTRP